VTGAWDLRDPQLLSALESEIERQASMIGYLDAFWFFSATALVVLPLVLFVRWKRS
jgi:DHA2 family multidrug resistance protein